jgi:hypothetical protein
MGTTIKFLLKQRGNGLATTIKYRRRTASGIDGNGMDTTIIYPSGAAGIALGTTIKYLRRTTRQRPCHHDPVPATHNERRRGQRPGHHNQVPVVQWLL